ncbi:MAG: hypothetical protein ACKOZM_04905 [Flavobacteriales bacterium]
MAIFISIDGHAQSDLREVRASARSIELEHPARVQQLMEWNDSLLTNRGKWTARYDSLLADSSSLTVNERSLVRLDGCMVTFHAQPNVFNYTLLKNAFQDFQPNWPQADEYVNELNTWMLETAQSQNDFSTAFDVQSKLQRAQENKWQSERAALRASADSVRKELNDTEKEHSSKVAAVNELLMQWHLGAMAAMLALVIVIIIFLVQKSNWKKQRNSLKAKMDDTSEKEALVLKLEESRRELIELKTLAKKKAEVPAVVPQTIADSKGLTAAEIAEWNEELQQALAKIKTHCEAGKNSMDVPTYMSIVNDVTRLSSRAGKKSEQWMAAQSAK